MINTFWRVFQFSCCLFNKKANYIEFRVLWEGKKKGKTRGAGGLNRATAHLGSSVTTEKFYRNRVSLALVTIGSFVSRQGSKAKRTTRPRCSRKACLRGRNACARDRVSLTLCRDRDLRVATWSPSRSGGLGLDKGFLYYDKALLGLMSRPGVDNAGRPCVAT